MLCLLGMHSLWRLNSWRLNLWRLLRWDVLNLRWLQVSLLVVQSRNFVLDGPVLYQSWLEVRQIGRSSTSRAGEHVCDERPVLNQSCLSVRSFSEMDQ